MSRNDRSRVEIKTGPDGKREVTVTHPEKERETPALSQIDDIKVRQEIQDDAEGG